MREREKSPAVSDIEMGLGTVLKTLLQLLVGSVRGISMQCLL